MKVLGIESSCDETACAIVEDGRTILSNVVATQIPFHKIYKGVVPEIASRKHAEWILPVVNQALKEASLTLDDVDAIAATNRPGLMGSLLVGFTFGKTLAWATNKPFIAINHMLGHLYAAQLQTPVEYPFLGLLTEYRADKTGIVHIAVGKCSMDADKIVANISTLLSEVSKKKPAGAAAGFIRSVSISSSMGPGVWVDYKEGE